MKSDTGNPITLLSMQALFSIGGNISSAGGVILLDNYDEPTDMPTSDMPFVNKLLKLQYYVLVICKTGYMEYRLDCNRPLTINAGDLVFFQQDQIVEFLGAAADTKVMLIAISKDIIINLVRRIPFEYEHQYEPFTPSSEFMDEIHTHYTLMKSCIENTASSFCGEIINYYTNIVLMKLAIEYNKGREKEPCAPLNRRLEIYHRFENLVKDNFKQHRDIEYYASNLFISSGHLARIIKSISGKTVGTWIKDYVILEAKVMLQSSGLTISQISDYLNFPNPSFFSKYFRAHTGITPGRYRGRHATAAQ